MFELSELRQCLFLHVRLLLVIISSLFPQTIFRALWSDAMHFFCPFLAVTEGILSKYYFMHLGIVVDYTTACINTNHLHVMRVNE